MGNRDDLLAGAKRCLVEKGYAGSTVRDIAGAANVSMAAIGYHFGSREALLNIALFELMDEWGGALATALAADDARTTPAQRYADMWTRAIELFTANRALFLASVEAIVLGERAPQLRDQLAGGLSAGRAGMAGLLLGVGEEQLDPDTVRGLGSVQLALISGILLQWLADPDGAPSGAEIVGGLRSLADVIDGWTER